MRPTLRTKSAFVMSPMTTTSSRPSSGCASGASHIEPPWYWPFATTTLVILPLRVSSPTRTRMSTFRQRRNDSTSVRKNVGLPPSAFERVFARRAVSALMPTLPTLTRCSTCSPPAHAWYVTRPTSITRVSPCSATSNACRRRWGSHTCARVHAGAAHQDGDLDVAPDDTVGDLVQRAVTADDDEQRRAAVDRIPREAPSGGRDPRRRTRRR